MARLTGFEVLAFDCYGTLIDWEKGLISALGPLTDCSETKIDRDRVLEDFANAESTQESLTPDLPFPEILAGVYRRLAPIRRLAGSPRHTVASLQARDPVEHRSSLRHGRLGGDSSGTGSDPTRLPIPEHGGDGRGGEAGAGGE